MLRGHLNAIKRFSSLVTFFLVFVSATVFLDVKPALADPCPSGWTFIGVNCERTYFYTGDKQTFTVPNGVRNISFIAIGGRGSSSSNFTPSMNTGSSAVVSGVLPTTGGQVLNLYVGGAGARIKGGWNGGGDGSISYYSSAMPSASQIRDPNFTPSSGVATGKGGGGGGATDIRIGGTALSNRVVVAGGGGGGAHYLQCSPAGWLYAGDPAHPAQPAYCGSSILYRGGSAYGVGGTAPTGLNSEGMDPVHVGANATASAGGARGALAPVSMTWMGCDTTNYASAGALGVGGNAGGLQRSAEPNYRLNGWTWEWCSGGGGGGGYYGGGGGTYGGGGAGSSYLAPSVTANTATFDASFAKPSADAFFNAYANIQHYGANPIQASQATTINGLIAIDAPPAGVNATSGRIRLAYRGTTVISVVPQAVNADKETTSNAIDYAVTFAEGVTGFGLGNLSISGASGTSGTWTSAITSGVSGSSTYTVRLSNSSAIDGPVTLTVDATGTTSVSNVPGLGNLSGTAIIDTTGPTLHAGVTNPTSTKTAPVVYSYTFDEPVSFVNGTPDLTKIEIDATVTPSTASMNNWIIGTPTISGNILSVTLTNPVALTSADSGLLSLKIAPGLVQDALGNQTVVSSSATVEVDYSVPTVVSFVPPADTKVSGSTRFFNAATVPYTLTFSEDVRHLYASNYGTAARQSFSFTGSTATGCVATPAASFTTNRQVTVNVTGCTEGTIVLKLLANRVEDLAGTSATFGAGNALVADNTAATITKDTVAPAFSSALASSTAANATTIDYTFTFNGPVYGIQASDLQLAGYSGTSGTWTKTLTSGTAGSTSYTIQVSNSEPVSGSLLASLPAGAATDIAGNATPASAGSGVDRTFYFPPELTLGTLNGLSGAGSVALAPNAEIKNRGTSAISGFRVVLKNFKVGDTLQSTYTPTTGFTSTLTTSGTDKILEISGSPQMIAIGTAQAILRAVKWSTTSTDRTARTIEVTLKPESNFLYDTRHFYKFMGGTYTNRGNANSAAQSSYFGAAKGYLPTIRSGAENSIVKDEARGQVIWLGARNSFANWSWQTWSGGPDDGVQFWDEPGWRTCVFSVCGPWIDNLGVGGSVGGRYSNWQTGLFNAQIEPNNTSDELSMDSNGQWDDGIGWFTNPTLVVEYGGQTVGDTVWDAKLFKSQSFVFDSTAPTLSLSSSADLVNNRASFSVTGSESIDCGSLTLSDLTTTGIDLTDVRISQIAPTACEISAAHTLTPGVQGTITLAKSGTFSMTDAAGNAQTAINGYAMQTITATPATPPSVSSINNAVSNANYTLVPPSSTTTGMTPTDPAAAAALNTALTQAKIVEPPVGAPGATGSRNIANQPSASRYELTDQIEVIQGTKVGAEFSVNSGRAATHEAWGYIRIGNGDWLNLGKQALTPQGGADLAKIGAMAFTQTGSYQLKIVVVPTGTIMPARASAGLNSRALASNETQTTVIRFGRASVSDNQLQGVGDDSYLLNISVIPASVPPTVVPVAPYVVSTSVTPTTALLKAGSEIAVTVTFSVPVDVSGSPQLKFAFNGVDYFATYQGGTGTTELSFTYTVQSNQNTNDLDYASASALELNGGSIVEAVSSGVGANAILGLSAPGAAGSISASAAVIIDTTAPTVNLYAEAATLNSTTLRFTVEGDTDLDCATLSSVAGQDFTLTGISAITGIVQTSSKICTITATSSVAPGATGPSTIELAPSFSITDTAGNETSQADLLTTIASIEVTAPVRPAAPSSSSTPTPTPTPSPTPTPAPTPRPTPSPTPSQTSSPSTTPRPSPSSSPSGTDSSNPSIAPSPSPSPSPSSSPSSSTSTSASGGNNGDSGTGGGAAALDPSDPIGSLGSLLDPGNLQLPTIEPGAPVANPAIGASGDDSAPEKPFDPFGTAESSAAVTSIVTGVGAAVAAIAGAAVAAAAGAAGAAGAAAGAGAGAAGAAGAGAGASGAAGAVASGSSASASSAVSSASATVSASAISGSAGSSAGSSGSSGNSNSTSGGGGSTSGGSGSAASAVLGSTRMRRLGSKFTKSATAASRISPLLAKVIMSAAYLRNTIGLLYWVLPASATVIAMFAAIQNGDRVLPPVWPLFIALAVIAVFDSLSGAVSFMAFALITVFAAGISSNADLAMLVAIALIWFAPGMVAKAFRERRYVTRGKIWETLVQASISAALVAWITTSAVSSLPAIAGKTLAVANHVVDFAAAVAIASVVRVLVEALIARKNPELLGETAVAQTSWAQRVISLLLRFSLFTLLAGAIFGYNGYVVVGSLLFVLPSALQWFSDKLPNFVWLWKLLPSGLPGLNLVLVISGLTSAWAAGTFTGEFAASMAYMVLPIPLLLLAAVKLFGRHGDEVDSERPVLKQSWVWVYRIGGIIMFVLSLKLMGLV